MNINYEKLIKLKNFGGIRVEDDVLVTEGGCRVLGPEIPKDVAKLKREVQRRD